MGVGGRFNFLVDVSKKQRGGESEGKKRGRYGNRKRLCHVSGTFRAACSLIFLLYAPRSCMYKS